jgi:hypothetical protein
VGVGAGASDRAWEGCGRATLVRDRRATVIIPETLEPPVFPRHPRTMRLGICTVSSSRNTFWIIGIRINGIRL